VNLVNLGQIFYEFHLKFKNMRYERFWLTQFKFYVNSVQSLNFYISSYISYIVVNKKSRIINIILGHYIKILIIKIAV
jgi:hypothetical protein